jgi:APA family basic amino acid/polyamine antiporter
MMIYGQTRIFFVMARDGLLPEKLATIHPKWKTPHIVTIVTGCSWRSPPPSSRSASWPTSPTPAPVRLLHGGDRGDGAAGEGSEPSASVQDAAIWVVAPIAMVGCAFLYFNLPLEESILVLPIWGALGLVIYFAYGYRKSHVGRGMTGEVHELDGRRSADRRPARTRR